MFDDKIFVFEFIAVYGFAAGTLLSIKTYN